MSIAKPHNPNESERRRGYRPDLTVAKHPVFQWPPQPVAIFRWLFGFPGYLWPWPAFFLGVALVSWLYLTPDLETMRNVSADWVALLFVKNLILLVLFVGAWHVRLYVQQAQGTTYKYNSRWLSVDNRNFLFGNQFWDNVFWNVCSAVPIWTAYQALTFWLQANGFVPTVSWPAHPLYCAVLILLTPIWLDIHFCTIHRLIHWPPLYRSVHYLHHKNVNFGPWSGVAMHPVEHLMFFSAAVLCWLIPSHPLHSVYLLQYLAMGASLAHLGFGRLVLSAKRALSTEDYMHYLHHKYFNANYGVDLVPLDRWLGTFHDGSDEAQELMKARMRNVRNVRKNLE
jgi:sterol desaturase/sphingolipid hydroxylase (fatty acid hydroxylase superfamily)